jgi:hypothetical protein
VSFSYSEMDQMIIQRWPDVIGLLEAQKNVQDRIEEMIGLVGERVDRWARPLGFETETSPRDAEIVAWRPAWADKRKGPKVRLAVGGFCPIGFRKIEEPYPYLWVKTDTLENFKMKEPEREAFARTLRSALGDQARTWEADGIDDADFPLGRYLTSVSDADRAKLIATPDALFAFVTDAYKPLFEIADVIETELVKLGR